MCKFPNLDILKKLNFIRKRIFHHFRPIRPFGPAAAHSYFFSGRASLFPLGLSLTAGPASPRPGGAPPNRHLPHRKMPPAAPPSPSLRARLTDGPHLSSLTSGPPELGRATTTRRSPRRPALPRMPPKLLPPRHHFPLLNPPLNLAPAFNGINAAITPPGHPSPALPLPL